MDCETPCIEQELIELTRSIYREAPPLLVDGIARLIGEATSSDSDATLWDHRDVVLITYADQIRADNEAPLQTLRRFLEDWDIVGPSDRLSEATHDPSISCVHLLPFCPFTSDDGFSVIDYLQVDSNSGSWQDIADLGQHCDLMFDLVLNHCSQLNRWFQGFLAGEPEYADFFVTANPELDLSAVTRPRSLPLLTPFKSRDGQIHVWTTFSADQVDLNYANPRVLLRMLEVLVEYARRGGRIIRLDAIAFLWKEVGTSCMHLPATHQIVRLMRAVLDRVVPGTLVLTETNVPHDENISYFGDGDEAHMVYQFSLPPLLLEAVCSGDTGLLKNWLQDLKPPYSNTTFFNFTASHDGIGVRPLEGLVPAQRLAKLIDATKQSGGNVNMRQGPNGEDRPYELNVTYLDAVAAGKKLNIEDHADRFMATQAVMLSLQGIPAVYFHSLVGSQNDLEGVRESGQNRRINRHKYLRDELDKAVNDPSGLGGIIFDRYRKLLKIRVQQRAFHPDAAQRVLDLPGDGLLGFERRKTDGDRTNQITVLANLSETDRSLPLGATGLPRATDLLASDSQTWNQSSALIPLKPFQVRWLSPEEPVE